MLGKAFSHGNPVRTLPQPGGSRALPGRSPQHEGGPSRPALGVRPNTRANFHKGILKEPGDTHANTGTKEDEGFSSRHSILDGPIIPLLHAATLHCDCHVSTTMTLNRKAVEHYLWNKGRGILRPPGAAHRRTGKKVRFKGTPTIVRI
uniref:Uncharacterized protein n=1 Tax=Rhipicephalus zambeziensis TaxID=60191 RepID=A0A224Z0A8_9ACAR